MFRTVFPFHLVPASKRSAVSDTCLLQYVQCLTPDDGRKDRPKHVGCYSNKIKFDTSMHLIGFTIEI